MYYNNDRGYLEPNREGPHEKLRTKSFWQRYAWTIVALLAVLVVIFASTTAYLLVSRQGKSQPTRSSTPVAQIPATPTDISIATSVPSNTSTVSTMTPTVPSSGTAITKNLHLTCISGCDVHVDVTLNFIVINTNNNRTEWHFTIKNVSSQAYEQVFAYTLYLEDPTGQQFQAGSPGTFTEENNPINSGQTLQEYASFLFLPTSGVNYTLHCTIQASGGGVESFQTEVFTF